MRSEEIAKGDADHVGPGARQRYRRRTTDSSRDTGDDGDLAV